MNLAISRALLRELEAEAAAAGGVEVCGLLLGQRGVISKVVRLRNVHAEPDRAFELDPVGHIAAARSARAAGLKILGHYHSHPSGCTLPSKADAALAAEQGTHWLIVAPGASRIWISARGGSMLGAFEPVLMKHL
jgi:proteasome lid subunit RPN8/RPN11